MANLSPGRMQGEVGLYLFEVYECLLAGGECFLVVTAIVHAVTRTLSSPAWLLHARPTRQAPSVIAVYSATLALCGSGVGLYAGLQ